jgi:hypothetical protein
VREVADSITWRRFCRIGLDGSLPHPTTLMKLTTRCGSSAVHRLNEALLAKAVEAKLLRTDRVRGGVALFGRGMLTIGNGTVYRETSEAGGEFGERDADRTCRGTSLLSS